MAEKTRELIIVIGFILLYTLAAVSVSLNRYWQYNAFWYDFGIFDETVWQLSRFQLPYIPHLNPPQGKIVWADHLNPASILVAPFYWLSSKQEIILVAQTLFVALSAAIAYLIARKQIKNAFMRISLIVSYLGFVGMQNALYTDVHNIVFSLPFLMAVFWAIFAKKWKLYWLFLLLFLGFQESLNAVGVGIGLYLLLRKDKCPKAGWITIAISLSWAFLSTQLIIPYFNQGPYSYQPNFPKYWYEWLIGLIYPFDLKLKTIAVSFITFGFLPIFSVSTYPLLFWHFLERFIFNSAATRWNLGFHYNALLSPILFIASLEVLLKNQDSAIFKKYLTFGAILNILLVIFIHRFYFHGPLMLATHPVFYEDTKKAKFLEDFNTEIPQNGLLMTLNNIAAHQTHRKVILLNLNYETIKPDVIALDVRPGQNANNFYPLIPADYEKLVNKLKNDKNYTLHEVTDSQLIFYKTQPIVKPEVSF